MINLSERENIFTGNKQDRMIDWTKSSIISNNNKLLIRLLLNENNLQNVIQNYSFDLLESSIINKRNFAFEILRSVI